MRRILVAALLACTCFQPAFAAPIAYDEATDGDLEGTFGFALPVLAFAIGTNTVKGIFSLSDSDAFAFSVPSGTRLVSGSATIADQIGNVTHSEWLLQRGSNVVGSGVLQESLLVLPPGSASLSGVPLGADTYHLTLSSSSGTSGSSASFSFEFVVAAVDVPEPATAIVLAAGLAALGRARRRSA